VDYCNSVMLCVLIVCIDEATDNKQTVVIKRMGTVVVGTGLKSKHSDAN